MIEKSIFKDGANKNLTHPKKNSGITLIALIITIVILLILAVVTIMAVNGDGIISKAKQAKSEYENAQAEEQGILDKYLAEMEGLAGNNITTGGTDNTDIKPQIGDKVAYDEGIGKTSNIDSSFVMKDMEWRILDIEEDGRIELISTQPTDSTLTLSGEQDWLNAETKLDTLCNDLYANGTGVTARSLKVEDINKLGNYDPTTYSDYGSLWRYKYDSTAGKIQYSKSTDNGSRWTDYENTPYPIFKYPGETEINSTNYQDSNGNPIVKELKDEYYYYRVANQVTQTTTDGISMASLISEGLNDTNDIASGSDKTQWLSSRCVDCREDYVYFRVRYLKSGLMDFNFSLLCSSVGHTFSPAYAVRPIVSLPSNVQLTQVDGIWQINM